MKNLLLTLALFTTCPLGSQTYSGPKCLGSFCIDRKTAVRNLFKQLGSPKRRASHFAPYCYQSQNGAAFLFIQTIGPEPDEAGDVLLSDFPNCMHFPTKVTTDDLVAWKTREGIGLGSLENDVVRAYGKPSGGWKIDSTNLRTMSFIIRGYRSGDNAPQVGDKTISYGGGVSKDLRVALFGIRSGKVAWIWLSVNE